MPPVSGRRRARKGSDLQKPEQDVQDTVQTPTRKRRRITGSDNITSLNSTSAPVTSKQITPAPVEDTQDTEDVEEVDAQSLADEIIRHLHIAPYEAAVVGKYHNDLVAGRKQAFAKIAGRNWTYYVSKCDIIIGRPNTKKPDATETDVFKNQQTMPDIDLGPDQQISRIHATINFDNENGWVLMVQGRNGVYVDDQRLDRNDRIKLQSGHVITIVGTQMMFLLPGQPPVVHQDIQNQLLAEDDDKDDSDADNKADEPPQSQSSAIRGRGRTANAQQSTQAVNNNNRGNPAPNSQLSLTTPAKIKEVHKPKLKSSPSYYKGVLIESAEEMDYSLESSKAIKPPLSYAALIGQSILAGPEEKATLASIYDYIKTNYAFYRHAGQGWQNSIRHNLSLSKCFEKVPRRTDEPGKGMKWQIVPGQREEFLKKNMTTKRSRGAGSSLPTSPAVNTGAAAQTERLMSVLGDRSSAVKKKRQRSITPPLSSYPTANESYTPDRGPQASFLTTGPLPAAPAANTPPVGSNAVTPSFSRTGGAREAAEQTGPSGFNNQMLRSTFNSPPTLTNTAYDQAPGAHLFTPLPPKSSLLAAVQSTAKAPSFYAKDLFSSPAPFWKFADIGSTPARLPELSPLKIMKDADDTSIIKSGSTEEDQEEEEDVEDRVKQHANHGLRIVTGLNDDEYPAVKEERIEIQPSSPPAAAYEHASPSRTVSRPISRSNPIAPVQADQVESIMVGPQNGHGKDLLAVPVSAPTRDDSSIANAMAPKSTSPVSSYSNPIPMLAMGPNPLARVPSFSRIEIEDDDDGDIDLTRGFEKIGSYHQSNQIKVPSR